MRNPLRRRVFRSLVERSVQAASVVIVPSERTAEALQRLGAPEREVQVIPLGVSEVFRPIPQDDKVAARARFADDKRYVAALYHSKPHKNLSSLFAAAQSLGPDDAAVVCAGAANLAPGSVRFTGFLSDDDLRMFYGGAEAFVLPSLVEGFGLPALEAAACGTPVVLGAGAGALPYIREAAEVVDVTSPSEIASALARLLHDHDHREELAARAVEIAQRLTIEATAQATLEVYETVLGQRVETTS